jgi:hypothetical protein
MKRLHRPDLYSWSVFNEDRNIDFHSVLWVRSVQGKPGNVVIDPLPMTPHDRAHLDALGGAAIIVVTNSDHVRDAIELKGRTGARLYGPAGERDGFPVVCDAYLGDGDEVVPGLAVLALAGSKTPGELALLLEETTLVTGDLVRAHEGGKLTLLPAAKLKDAALAQSSVARLAALPHVEAVLPGDGWPVFQGGRRALAELSAQ